ncbi:peptide transporter, partial [Klebsiella pneumoniae]
EFLGLNSLVVAVGLYLPIHITAPVMIGGVIRWLIDTFTKEDALRKARQSTGTLFASGLIAGESLVGVIIAALIFIGVTSGDAPVIMDSSWVSLAVFLVVTVTLWMVSRRAKADL